MYMHAIALVQVNNCPGSANMYMNTCMLHTAGVYVHVHVYNYVHVHT